ncbi:hypothetical protein L7F22_001316 [Adiantum nelumboides]|nr:hypothetical protein [Adiantum nelumboides]
MKSSSTGSKDRPLWYPGCNPLTWLDGSLVGDYGFDTLCLSKPTEYLQYDFDSLNQNLAKNQHQSYAEAFGLQHFCECKLIHGRWAMLATLGALAVEAFTGVTWQDAGKRNGQLDPEKRPGGNFFDPLGLASHPEKKEVLKLAEIEHAKLAMVGAFGFAVQAAATGKGPLDNWATHLSDPLHTTIIDNFTK